jgi:hypothetical protein
MTGTTGPDEAYPAGDDPVVGVPAGPLHATIETLNRFHQFFRHHASDAVHAELRAFCQAQGWHGVCGAESLLDDLGWDAYALHHALGGAGEAGGSADRP